MPRLTIALDITASASTPGTRKSTGCGSVVFTASTLVKNTRMPSGIASVTTRLSPRRSVRSNSTRVCAVTARAFTCTSSLGLLAGQAEEHLLQRSLARPELAEQDVLVVQPCGELRDHRRRRGHVDDVLPRSRFAHTVDADLERVRELLDVETGCSREAHVVAGVGRERR